MGTSIPWRSLLLIFWPGFISPSDKQMTNRFWGFLWFLSFLEVLCPGEDVAEARKMATAGRPALIRETSGPAGFCARRMMRMCKGVLEESWRCSQDSLGYSTWFEAFRVDLQSNLPWALITWSSVLMLVVVERHCFFPSDLQVSLNLAVWCCLGKVSGDCRLKREACGSITGTCPFSTWTFRWNVGFTMSCHRKRGVSLSLAGRPRS